MRDRSPQTLAKRVTTIAVVVVNYRTPDLVIDCLKSLREEARNGMHLKVYVGDASSGDGSYEKISAFIAEAGLQNVLCFEIGRNGGFAYGNNAIVERYVLDDPQVDYVHFLNPDTYIHTGAVRALAEFLAANERIGVVGSRLENPDGSPRAFGFRFPAPWREFFRGARLGALDRLFPRAGVHIPDLSMARRVDWVTGASFMVPRRVLDQVGLMDPGYFLYFEEVDLMARIAGKGFEIWHVAESRVVHLAGQATGVRAGAITRMPPYWFHSRFKFFRDRYGRAGAVLANVLFLAGDVIYRLHRGILRRPNEDPPYLWRDMLVHGFSLPPKRDARA